MPRQTRYLLQALPKPGASWQTLQKTLDERSAVYYGDQLAGKTDACELRVMHGSERIEHWLLRDKPAGRSKES